MRWPWSKPEPVNSFHLTVGGAVKPIEREEAGLRRRAFVDADGTFTVEVYWYSPASMYRMFSLSTGPERIVAAGSGPTLAAALKACDKADAKRQFNERVAALLRDLNQPGKPVTP